MEGSIFCWNQNTFYKGESQNFVNLFYIQQTCLLFWQKIKNKHAYFPDISLFLS